MKATKIILSVTAVIVTLAAIPQIKPVLHYLKAQYGWWGWGPGMLAVVAATGVLLWISAKLTVAARSKQAAMPLDRQRPKP
jgi:hypothetical protein